MPLFFVLSGFFTTMLWRRRGLDRLLRHRIRRIAVPFALLVLPMGLAMTWTVEQAVDAGISDYIEENDDIWAAVFFGNEDAVKTLLDRGIDVDAQNLAEGGDTPLHIVALTGDAEMAELLIERGADPGLAAGDGRPIEYAVFFGNADVADVLVGAGAADPRPTGSDWVDIEFWAQGAGDSDQIAEDLSVDPWVGAGWAQNLNHLWFLWFLLWLIAGFAVCVVVIERVSTNSATPGVPSGALMWAMIPLTLVPQLLMGEGGDVRVFGPDTSTGWIPVWHVLAYYAVFFVFGALLYGRTNRSGRPFVETIGHRWMIVLPLAVIAFVTALDLTFESDASWTIASIAQVAYAWLAIIALMGLFRAVLSTERRGVRYLSDSAYFLYLAHLPLVILAQIWIRNWDLPAAAKFGVLLTTVTVLLLVAYQLFVRYTPIGTLLNGERSRPTAEVDEPASAVPARVASPVASSQSDPLDQKS